MTWALPESGHAAADQPREAGAPGARGSFVLAGSHVDLPWDEGLPPYDPEMAST